MLSVTENDGSLHGAPGAMVQSMSPIPDEPGGVWMRLEVRLYVPSRMDDPVCQFRLYAPGPDETSGQIVRTFWDHCELRVL